MTFGPVAGASTDVAPTFTVTTASSTACDPVKDEFIVKFTNQSAPVSGGTDYYNFQVTGLSYNVAPAVTAGKITIQASATNARTAPTERSRRSASAK